MIKIQTEVAGNVWKIEVAVGQQVAAGDTLIIIESMKMEIPIEAPSAGKVLAILVAEGQAIAENALVIAIG
jgi:acetyl-CoA carboxylase biotin carboxyl carrier protein